MPSTLRANGRTLFARVIAAPTLRLSLGRWPNSGEQTRFQAAFADPAIRLPPLIRGFTAVTAMQAILGTALHLSEGWAVGSPLAGNVLTAWTGPKLAFMHLEKCGGIAVMLWLTPQFHPAQIDPDPWRAMPPHQCYRGVPGLGPDLTRYSLLWGHFGLAPLERIDPGRFVFTFLREPRARLISIYHYWRSVRPDMVDAIEQDPIIGSAHRNDLLGFLRDPEPSLRDYIENFYTRRLTDCYATGALRDPLSVDPQARLAEALAALDRVGFIGISERMDESVRRLAGLIGATPPDQPVRGNVTAESHIDSPHFFRSIERSPITPEIEAEIDRLTVLDRVIYQEALARFEANGADERERLLAPAETRVVQAI